MISFPRYGFKLFLLKEGESLEQRASELRSRDVAIADITVIRRWLEDNPSAVESKPIVIADLTAEPVVRGADPVLIYVPCHAVSERGSIIYDGLIDLRVPMWSAKAGGQLAILGILP